MNRRPGTLLVLRCPSCGWSSHMGGHACPSCGEATETAEMFARGVVHAETLVHRATSPSPIGPAPFVIVLVTVEGIADRVMALAPGPLGIGRAVAVGPLGEGVGAPYLAVPAGAGGPDAAA